MDYFELKACEKQQVLGHTDPLLSSEKEINLKCERYPPRMRRKEDLLISTEIAPEESANEPQSLCFLPWVYFPTFQVCLPWEPEAALLCPVISLQIVFY